MKNKLKKLKIYVWLQSNYTKIKYYYINKKFDGVDKKNLKFDTIPRGSRVLYIGTDELQDYSGFIQELRKFCELTVFTRYDNSYGQYSENKYKGIKGRDLNTQRLEQILEELKLNSKLPSVILTQSWGRLWNIDTLKVLKDKYGFRLINICMDDRHSFYMLSLFHKHNRGSSGLIPLLDGALVTSKESIFWYEAHSVPSLYFPEATSTDFYSCVNLQKKYDVGFVGAKYGLRGEYIQHLIDSGIQVEAYGTGWENGRIDNSNVNQFMNECRIVIGFGYILGCHDFMALKLRDFDVPATGTFYLTTDNVDLYELYPEKTGCYFSNKESLLERVRYFLNNENEREMIALTSYRNTIDNHTYDKRFEGIFK